MIVRTWAHRNHARTRQVPSLTRGKCLDADGIAILPWMITMALSCHCCFVTVFAMVDHYGFVMALVLCHPAFVYAIRQIIDAHIPWQPYMRT